MIETAGWVLGVVARELTLFAAVALLIGGIDDLAVDLLWAGRTLWRRATIYRRYPRATAATLAAPHRPGRIAILVPAWHEAAVIGPMLRTALANLRHADYRLYVGTYPNDPATGAAVAAIADPRVRHVPGDVPGPTTKADCLNRLWAAVRRDEVREGRLVKAVVLHDAEDVVHPDELVLFDTLIERFDLVQLPVLPLVDARSRWVSGHYVDEFAEAHGRAMAVREALGAALPSAGTGCALARAALVRMAGADGHPFDAASLTEDYELGLRLRGRGDRAAFVAMRSAPGAPLVAVRAFFPATLDAAVRQKTRWMIGIALAGWDRLGWAGGVAECWMRLRDRRSILAAGVILAGYAGVALGLLCRAVGITIAWPHWADDLLLANAGILVWRLGARALTVGYYYGAREGLRAVPRVFVANVIAIAAAWRALVGYVPGVTPGWDKTQHRFPGAACD